MKYSELKAIKSFCNDDLVSQPDWREVVNNIEGEESDFEVDNVRFIDADYIDEVMQDELASDNYALGCFNDWFIADVTGIDSDVIKSMQKAGAHEAIGKLIKSLGKLEELQQQYASADSYGHHFNHYDFSEETINVCGRTYYVFDNR